VCSAVKELSYWCTLSSSAAAVWCLAGERWMLCAGMKDLGLYRVSGVLNEIQKLKKAFEKSESIPSHSKPPQSAVSVRPSLWLSVYHIQTKIRAFGPSPPRGCGLWSPKALHFATSAAYAYLPIQTVQPSANKFGKMMNSVWLAVHSPYTVWCVAHPWCGNQRCSGW